MLDSLNITALPVYLSNSRVKEHVFIMVGTSGL